jgi:gliding motility-associated-like protein
LISLKDDNDCEALATGLSSSATARKKAIPEAPVFTASSEVSSTNSVCQGTAYTITAESSTTSARITWTSPSALADQTNPSEISGTTTGSVVEYKAKAVLEGCESTEELQSITLNPSATVSISVDQAVRCESDQAVNNPVFTATALGHNVASGYSWIWVDEDGLETPLGTTNTPSFSQLSTLGRENVTMHVEVENNIACGSALLRSATPAVVTVVETPVVQIEEYISDGERTKYVCSYDMPYTLNAKVQSGLSVAYSWYDGLGNEIGTTQSYKVLSSGTYNVIATTTSNGVSCASDQGYVTVGDDAEVEVNIQDLKVTAVSTAYDVEQGEVVILTASPEGAYPVVSELAYDWSFNGSGIGSGQQLEHVVMATGVYRVVLTDELTNCEADTMLTINMLEPVTIPTAFTPNGDSENDVWEIPGLETYRQANLKLFNRWGQLVYEMSGTYSQDFDGRRGGTDLPVGTYYYVIKLNVPGREPIKGDLTILR